MRDDIDKLIEETLSDEDKEILDHYGGERGFVAEALSAFTHGPSPWVIWFVYIAQAVFFVIGVYLAWQFFQTADVLIALRYGLSALLFMIMAAIFKSGMGIRIETNRTIREIKRVELQVAMLRAKMDE